MTAAVVDGKGTMLGKAGRAIDPTRDPLGLLLHDVAEVARAAIGSAGVDVSAIRGLGMGLPGNVDRVRGVCRFSPNLKWRDVPVSAPLRECFGFPVFLLNDVRTHTLGEMHFGAGHGVGSFVMLALGTGIGGGVVMHGKLVEGAHSAGGEIGHITVQPDGPLCGCGNRGCVEALASGPAIARAGREAVERGESTEILSMAGSLDAISAATVSAAASVGDEAAAAIWREVGRHLGTAIASVITTVDPERVLVGGGVGRAGELLLAPTRAEVARRCRMIPAGGTPILPAALGDEAGLIGAGALALESLGLLRSGLMDTVEH